MSAALWPIPAEGIANLHKLLDSLKEMDDATGGFEFANSQVHRKSVTLTVRFDKEIDVMTTGVEFVNRLARCPSMLADACRRLIAAHEASGGGQGTDA